MRYLLSNDITLVSITESDVHLRAASSAVFPRLRTPSSEGCQEKLNLVINLNRDVLSDSYHMHMLSHSILQEVLGLIFTNSFVRDEDALMIVELWQTCGLLDRELQSLVQMSAKNAKVIPKWMSRLIMTCTPHFGKKHQWTSLNWSFADKDILAMCLSEVSSRLCAWRVGFADVFRLSPGCVCRIPPLWRQEALSPWFGNGTAMRYMCFYVKIPLSFAPFGRRPTWQHGCRLSLSDLNHSPNGFLANVT